MFRKISTCLLFIIIMKMWSGGYSAYAQDTMNIVFDRMTLNHRLTEDPNSIPFFTVDSLYNSLLDDALDLQHAVDSMDEAAFQYRQQIMFIDDTYEKIKLQQKVVVLEEDMRELQAEADSLFMILNEMTKPEPEVRMNPLLILDTVIEGIKVYHYNLDEFKKLQHQTEKGEINKEEKVDSVLEYEPGKHYFSIQPQSPYSPDHPFEYDFQVPDGVFYRIQLAAFSQEIKYNHFGGINPITTQLVNGGEVMRYFAGKFTNYSEAESSLGKVRSAGFKDAFIVGYYNGQRMSVDRVREFEKIHH